MTCIEKKSNNLFAEKKGRYFFLNVKFKVFRMNLRQNEVYIPHRNAHSASVVSFVHIPTYNHFLITVNVRKRNHHANFGKYLISYKILIIFEQF